MGIAGCESTDFWFDVSVFPRPTITAPKNYISKNEPVLMETETGYESHVWKESNGSNVGTDRTYQTNIQNTYTVTVTKMGAAGTSLPFEVGDQFFDMNMNFIVINTAQQANLAAGSLRDLPAAQVVQQIQYFDELGRPIQNVTTQGSPSHQDIVQPIAYDLYGREPVTYLPYTSEDNGRYKADFKPKDHTEYSDPESSPQYSFYQQPNADIARDEMPYAETVFEPSPLNRVLRQGAAGSDWQPLLPSGHSVKKRYRGNVTEEVLFFLFNEGAGRLELASPKHYLPNKLFAAATLDESDNEVIEFTNKEGQTVCKKVQYKGEAGIKYYAETYYLYDDLGKLIVVLPPEGVKKVLEALDQN